VSGSSSHLQAKAMNAALAIPQNLMTVTDYVLNAEGTELVPVAAAPEAYVRVATSFCHPGRLVQSLSRMLRRTGAGK
jgi:hypothetical protein